MLLLIHIIYNIIYVILIDPNVSEIYPDNQTVNIGDPVRIGCRSVSPVMWRFKKTSINAKSNYSFETFGDMHVLTIESFHRGYEGKYTCLGKQTQDEFLSFYAHSWTRQNGNLH